MDIAILGAGVAGVSSAIALKQTGFDVRVYERQESALNIGAGIVVWPNAAYVLDQLGVLEEMKSVSGRPARMRRLSRDNEELGAIDINLINRQMGYPSLSILRRDFQDILISKLESIGVNIQYASPITDIKTNTKGRAEVYFQNGKTTNADIVIGADGRMASFARRYVHGDNKPNYQGFINWIGVFESETDCFQDIEVKDYWGVGERFGIVPVTKSQAYWAGGVASQQVGQRVPAEYKRELTEIFSSWPGDIQKVIQQTPVERINKIYVHDHDPIQTWHKNNLVIIGDAAHAPLPTSGQGACQALEDAWHLASCLHEHSDDLDDAFSRFTKIRFEKTSGIIMGGRGFASSLFNESPEFCATRNENSRNTDFSGVAAAMSRGWAQGLPLSA